MSLPDELIQFWIKVAEVNKLPVMVDTDDDGNIKLAAQDKIDFYSAYKEILRGEIENKVLLIQEIEKESSDPAFLVEYYRSQDEIWKLRRELLDLQNAYVSKDYYNLKHKGQVKYGLEQMEKNLPVLKKEVPLLIEKLKEILNGNYTLTEKTRNIMIGILSRYDRGITTAEEFHQIHTDLSRHV